MKKEGDTRGLAVMTDDHCPHSLGPEVIRANEVVLVLAACLFDERPHNRWRIGGRWNRNTEQRQNDEDLARIPESYTVVILEDMRHLIQTEKQAKGET